MCVYTGCPRWILPLLLIIWKNIVIYTKRFVRHETGRSKGTRGKLHHSLRRSFYFEFILLWKRTSNVNSVPNPNEIYHFFFLFQREGRNDEKKSEKGIGSNRFVFDRSNERASTTNDTNEARTINEMEPLLSSSLRIIARSIQAWRASSTHFPPPSQV